VSGVEEALDGGVDDFKITDGCGDTIMEEGAVDGVAGMGAVAAAGEKRGCDEGKECGGADDGFDRSHGLLPAKDFDVRGGFYA